jgi:hypothetical protein
MIKTMTWIGRPEVVPMRNCVNCGTGVRIAKIPQVHTGAVNKHVAGIALASAILGISGSSNASALTVAVIGANGGGPECKLVNGRVAQNTDVVNGISDSSGKRGNLNGAARTLVASLESIRVFSRKSINADKKGVDGAGDGSI